MKKALSIPAIMIAPCGMNCGICAAHLREKNTCAGCIVKSPQKLHHCYVCSIGTCTKKSPRARFCFDCASYPCLRLKKLDLRYRTKYGMSMIENLNAIEQLGIRRFMKYEIVRRACPVCGNPVCIHNKQCYDCQKKLTPGRKLHASKRS